MSAPAEFLLQTETLRCGYGLCLVATKKDGGYPEPPAGMLLVIDDRDAPDPSFRIVESCRISRRQHRREILLALLAYDAQNPADPPWQRSLRSMEKEWVIHNLAYRLRLFTSSARDVDLNNAEEGRGWRHFFLRGLAALRRRLRRG